MILIIDSNHYYHNQYKNDFDRDNDHHYGYAPQYRS